MDWPSLEGLCLFCGLDVEDLPVRLAVFIPASFLLLPTPALTLFAIPLLRFAGEESKLPVLGFSKISLCQWSIQLHTSRLSEPVPSPSPGDWVTICRKQNKTKQNLEFQQVQSQFEKQVLHLGTPGRKGLYVSGNCGSRWSHSIGYGLFGSQAGHVPSLSLSHLLAATLSRGELCL